MKRSILILTVAATLIALAMPAFAAKSVTKSFKVSVTIPAIIDSSQVETSNTFKRNTITIDYVKVENKTTMVKSLTVL